MLLAMLLAATAQAHCTLAALETTLRAGAAPERIDRWTWRVEAGPPDCAEVHLASPQAAPITAVQASVQRPDARAPRLKGERRAAVAASRDPGFGPSAGLVLLTPELREGDLLLVEVQRAWPVEEGGFTWRPGARGALEIATLRVEGEVEVQAEGLALGAPLVEGAARTWLVEGVPAGAAEPFGDGPPRVAAPSQVELRLELLLPQRRPVRGLSDPELGATRWVQRQVGGLPARVVWPVQAPERRCTVDGAPCVEVGGLAWALPATGEATWSWVTPGAAPSGEVSLAGEGRRDAVRLEVVAPGPVELTGATAEDLDPAAADDAAAATAGWRLRALGELPILPDAAAARQALAWLAIRASIPEPALYDELRGRRQDPTVLPDLLTLHHARLHVGRLPGQDPLQPRPLLRVRRSGWGSPWELALVLTRQLRQLKLDAVPLPVRPVELGPADPASLSGWPLAVVRITSGDQVLWVDPTCSTCGPGELTPDFDQAATLSAELQRLPPLPASTWVRRVSPAPDGLEVQVELSGPLAVRLRADLAALPPGARASWLARYFGGVDARLDEHQGLTQRDAGVRLRLWVPRGARLPAPLPAPVATGAAQVVLPARGTWVEQRLLGPDEGLPAALGSAEAQGLRWSRALRAEEGGTVLEERLEVDDRVLPRAGAFALLSRLNQDWGRVERGTDPPAGSPPPAPAPPGAP